MVKLLFASTIFSSAFLLFLVQPLISKHILPWFGGSAGVWATCMVFFQSLLLAGYAYADWVTRRLRPRTQVLLHAALLLASVLSLRVLADPSWKPTGQEDPTLWILLVLAASIGLPYFLLSTTGPLIQAWVSRTLVGTRVYRLFSLSNLASLLALVSYPFLIEPQAALRAQAQAWSAVYTLFALLCTATGLYFWRRADATAPGAQAQAMPAAAPPPPWRQQWPWLALSALGSWLLVAVTNHITQDVASVPFLWLLPLSLYLLNFVLCFESDRWWRRERWLPPTVAVLLLCAWGLHNDLLGQAKIAIPLYSLGMFLLCMLLHGELAARRPAAQHLTRFYLMVSLGGALGGACVALLAPRLLPGYYELGIAFVLVSVLVLRLLRGSARRQLPGAVLVLGCSASLLLQIGLHASAAQRMSRNFYGTLMTVDTPGGQHPQDARRMLVHGTIKHGEQYLAPERRREPTTYYGPDSGVGLALRHTRAADKRVGLIGMGTGTLATYGRPGDVYRFYEINPEVISIAQTDFSFLGDSAARVEIVQGDARLALEQEASNRFDVLAVDAFSGDSVPVHLLTREALRVYLRHIDDAGIVAFHVSNKFVNLAPVVQQLARDQGAHAVFVRDEPARGSLLHPNEWMLVAKSAAVLEQPALRSRTRAVAAQALPTWTDDFNNLFQVLK